MRIISSYAAAGVRRHGDEQEVFESIFLIARARGPWNASVGKIKYIGRFALFVYVYAKPA